MVGYRDPPAERRWQKNCPSPNPRGRPRKARGGPKLSFHPAVDMMLAEFGRPMPLREAGQEITLPAMQAVTRSTLASAIKGNVRAQELCHRLNKEAHDIRLRDMVKMAAEIERYKAAWPAEARRAAHLGLPPPLPHPDHYHFNVKSGLFEVTGPINQAQQEVWDEIKALVAVAETDLADCKREAAERPEDEVAQRCFRWAKAHMRKVKALVPAGWNSKEQLEWPTA
jgi:hypothetical protein